MLTNQDFNDTKSALHLIDHAKEDSKRIPFETLLSILEFVLLGIKTIFFDKMGKPKNKLQLILSLPSIIKFVREVIVRIGSGKKELSNEAKVSRAIEDGVRKANPRQLKEGGIVTGASLGMPPDSPEAIAPISILRKHAKMVDDADRINPKPNK